MEKKYFVLQMDGTWKEIAEKDVKKFLDYGCQIRCEKIKR